MTETTKVSVFCLAYNHEKYIRDALNGFVMQKTDFKFEVLIHEDASTDGTAAIVREYEEKYPDLFRVVYQTENQYSKKINNTRQYLLPMAKGKYFAWCEGDDCWTDPYKIQKQFDFMETHPEYTMCMHRAVMYDWSNLRYTIVPNQQEAKDYTVEETLDIDSMFSFASTFTRREIFENLPQLFLNRVYTDIPLRIYAGICGKIHCLQDVMSTYNYRTPGSTMERLRSKDKSYSIAYNQSAIDMLDAIIEQYGDKYKEVVQKRKAFYEYHRDKHLGKLEHIQEKQFERYRITDQKRKDKEDMRSRMVPEHRTHWPDYREYCEEIKDLWEWCHPTGYISKRHQLQIALEAYLNTQNVVLLANIRTAMMLTLNALDLPKGGEVITTNYAPSYVAESIVRNGMTPVFCDINDQDFTIDTKKIESLITKKTCAIAAVHTYGHVCDVTGIQEIANKHNLKVIYDATQALGAFYQGVNIAKYGDATIFNSMSGGAVACNSCALRVKIELMIGEEADDIYSKQGESLSELHAAMGLLKLRNIDHEIKTRKCLVDHYRSRLASIEGIHLFPEQKDVRSGYTCLPVICEEEIFGMPRDELVRVLSRRYITAINGLPTVDSTFFSDSWDRPISTPIAMQMNKKVILLPLFAGLELSEVDKVCDTLLELKNQFTS